MDIPKLTPLQRFLQKRHVTRGAWAYRRSWRDISDEIQSATGKRINRGLLCNIASGKREPSNHVIDLINATYRKRFKHRVIVAHVAPCDRCGGVHITKRCPTTAPKYAPHPVMRLSKLRRLMQSPYSQS